MAALSSRLTMQLLAPNTPRGRLTVVTAEAAVCFLFFVLLSLRVYVYVSKNN